MLRSSLADVQILHAISHTVKTASGNGTTIDLQDALGVYFVVDVGVSGDTLSGSVYWELELEAAADDGTGSPDTWAAVTSADDVYFGNGTSSIDSGGVFALIDAPAEDDAIFSIGYVGLSGEKRFVRAVITATGTHSNGTPIGITAHILPRTVPATNT